MDELVKRLRERAEAFDYDGWVETASDYEKAADAIEGLSHAVDQMTEWRKNPWIPVEERLPSEDGFTLIFTAHGHVGVCYFTNGWWGGYGKDGITHWMPLQSAPMEE